MQIMLSVASSALTWTYACKLSPYSNGQMFAFLMEFLGNSKEIVCNFIYADV